jgi:hypothetical protein
VKGPCTPISVYIVKAALSNDACARNLMLFDDIMHVGVVAASCAEGRAAMSKASICEASAVALGRWSPKRQWGLCLSVLKLLLSLSFHSDGQASISRCEARVISRFAVHHLVSMNLFLLRVLSVPLLTAPMTCKLLDSGSDGCSLLTPPNADSRFPVARTAKFMLIAYLSFGILRLSHTVCLQSCLTSCVSTSLCSGKAHFLASSKPTEMVLRGLSSSDSNGMCRLLFHVLCFKIASPPDCFVQWQAWLHQLQPLHCIAIKSFLRSGVAAR